MIRRSPAEFYIKYLLVHPDEYSDEDIELTLKEHQLDNPGSGYFDRLRKRLKVPKPFYPYNDQHPFSWRFLMREKIFPLFHPDHRMLNALNILHKPRAKEAVEAMTLVNDPPALICHRLLSMGVRVDIKDLQRYQHFFWNIQLVDSTELRALLAVRVDEMVLNDAGGANQVRAGAMKMAAYMDPRWVASRSYIPEVAALRNQMRFGYMPDRIDLARLVNAAAVIATSRILDELSSSHPHAARNSEQFSQVATNMLTMLELIGSPDEEMRKDLTALGLETDELDTVKGVEVLTEGTYTSEMQLLTGGTTEDAGKSSSESSST